MKIVRISIQISMKFVPKGPIANKSALFQVMAWRRTGDKPLPEALMTQFIDAYMRHWGELKPLICMTIKSCYEIH